MALHYDLSRVEGRDIYIDVTARMIKDDPGEYNDGPGSYIAPLYGKEKRKRGKRNGRP